MTSNTVTLSVADWRAIPTRTCDTQYEVGKLYKTMDEHLTKCLYVFKCEAMGDGHSLALTKVIIDGN